MSLWDRSFQVSMGRNALQTLNNRLYLLEVSLGLSPSSPSYLATKVLAKSFHDSSHTVSLNQTTLFLLLRGLQTYYQNPLHRLGLIDEILRHMSEFRFHTFGEEGGRLFEEQLKRYSLDLLKPVQLQFKESSSDVYAFIEPHPLMDWTIYFNPISFQEKFQVSTLASFLEYCLIHELTHLIQFQLRLHLELIKIDTETKKWQDRWHEREAMYTSERVCQALLYTEKTSHQIAREVVEGLATQESVSSVLNFKEDILIPHYQVLKEKKSQNPGSTFKFFQLSV